MSHQDTDDRQDLEYAQNRVAEVNERAAKAVSQLAGIESNAAPTASLRMAHSDLCQTLANTNRAIAQVEQAITARRDGHGRAMPREITSEHADRFDEIYDGPVYYLAIQLLEKNRHEYLYATPDTYGAEQIERHGLTENQRKWLGDLQDAWQAHDEVYDPRTIDDDRLSNHLRTVVSESRNENWGNVRANLESALEAVDELAEDDSE
ncbi:hypothetical protein [Natrinema gari]|uniref:Uncharacterized protein n=1 Tax=Natrinema gari JCM 14663 TaxID=1230459 RepID=L9ZFN4_9EURY|nr:hypothetical protein [Natrinema gari]ELY85270.1 hypothetical protein C486_00220 [Natrinema gari JCM 14663]